MRSDLQEKESASSSDDSSSLEWHPEPDYDLLDVCVAVARQAEAENVSAYELFVGGFAASEAQAPASSSSATAGSSSAADIQAPASASSATAACSSAADMRSWADETEDEFGDDGFDDKGSRALAPSAPQAAQQLAAPAPPPPPSSTETMPPGRAGLRCANPRCWYLVHTSPSFGGYCCKKCHWLQESGSRSKKHGVQCQCVDAPEGAPRAPPVPPGTAWPAEPLSKGRGKRGDTSRFAHTAGGMCERYKNGNCKFGGNCRFSHSL